MRIVLLAALAVLTAGFVSARPASAAWECIGGEHVCGTPSSAKATKKAYKKAAYKKEHYKKAKYAGEQRAKKAKYASKRTKKAAHVASYERRATKRARAVESSGSYGGGSSGIASYYWQGTRTASGARFNPNDMTAAHRTLPFGTRVLVTNQSTGQSVTVTINDRGPFVKGRIIDLSSAAAGAIGMKGAGLARVSISVLGRG
jgi:rare lipoprotein A